MYLGTTDTEEMLGKEKEGISICILECSGSWVKCITWIIFGNPGGKI